MVLAIPKTECHCVPALEKWRRRVIAHMDRQYMHALVLDANTDYRDTGTVSHTMRFFEMIEINELERRRISV